MDRTTFFNADPSKTAIVDPNGASLSYGELESRIMQAAQEFARTLPAGSKILMYTPTMADSIIVQWAAVLADNLVIPAPARMGEAELSRLRDFYQPDLELDASTFLYDITADFTPYSLSLKDNPTAAFVWHSSGTTLAPRGCVIQQSALHSYLQLGSVFDLTSEDRVQALFPLGSCPGFTISSQVLAAGATLLLESLPWDPYQFVENAIAKEATTTVLAPAMVHDLLKNELNVRVWDRVYAGSAPVSDELKEAWHDRTDLSLIDVYATTETGVILRDGIPTPGVSVEVHDTGRLSAHTSTQFLGYYGEAASPEFHDTGDFVQPDQFSSAGALKVVGRWDDVINVGGFLVRPEGLDESLRAAGIQGVVAGIKDDRLGQIVGVFVTDDTTLEQARVACSGHADYKLPRQLVRLPELPMTPSGKLKRSVLSGG